MLKKLLSTFRRKCYFCKSTTPPMRRYITEKDEPIHVCSKCLEYAERRAFRKQ